MGDAESAIRTTVNTIDSSPVNDIEVATTEEASPPAKLLGGTAALPSRHTVITAVCRPDWRRWRRSRRRFPLCAHTPRSDVVAGRTEPAPLWRSVQPERVAQLADAHLGADRTHRERNLRTVAEDDTADLADIVRSSGLRQTLPTPRGDAPRRCHYLIHPPLVTGMADSIPLMSPSA